MPEDTATRSITILLFIAATSTAVACRTDAVDRNAERAAEATTHVITRTITFQHQDAKAAANHARAEFGRPPMQGEVQIVCAADTNAWIVKATAPDMARVEQIAARYDQPGEAPWKQGR